MVLNFFWIEIEIELKDRMALKKEVDALKDWANKKLDDMNDGMKYRLGKMGGLIPCWM